MRGWIDGLMYGLWGLVLTVKTTYGIFQAKRRRNWAADKLKHMGVSAQKAWADFYGRFFAGEYSIRDLNLLHDNLSHLGYSLPRCRRHLEKCLWCRSQVIQQMPGSKFTQPIRLLSTDLLLEHVTDQAVKEYGS